jgi:glycosyltransferase involved in cell wall biosynthesis
MGEKELLNNLYDKIAGSKVLYPPFRAAVYVAKKMTGMDREPVIINNVVSENPELIAICHPFDQGIKSATYALTGDIIEIEDFHRREQVEEILSFIKEKSPGKIVLSGYGDGYDLLAVYIKELLPDVRIMQYCHASFTQYSVDKWEADFLERLIQLHFDGVIEKIGFCKKGMIEHFIERGVDAHFLMNRFPKIDVARKIVDLNNPSIAVLGSKQWRKNLLNQIIGALQVENAKVHINQAPEYDYVKTLPRVIEHGWMTPDEAFKLTSSTTLNFYISLSECFPMVVIESLATLTPCLTSNTSNVYDYDPSLKDYLVVNELDNPLAISAAAERVLHDYDIVIEKIKNYLPILSKEIDNSINAFLI